MDSRVVTNYLKGLAILSVMELHYAEIYAQSVIPEKINIYISQVVYFFFVLSGYGLYHSLEKRFGGGLTLKTFMFFYFRRAVRIFPLFWLAMLLVPLFLKNPQTWELSAHNAGIYLGLPWLRPDSWFWFIPALIQCYLAAPFLFLLMKKIKPWHFLFGIFMATDLLIFFGVYYVAHYSTIPQASLLGAFILSGTFLTNIILFSIGLVMPLFIEEHRELLRKTAVVGLPASLAMIALSFYLTKTPDVFFNYSQAYYTMIAIAFIPLFCAFMIALGSQRVMPFKGIFCLLGINSLSLYLFHPHFYGLLNHLGITRRGYFSVSGSIISLTVFPLFVLVCYGLERSLPRIGARVKRLLAPVKNAIIGKMPTSVLQEIEEE